MSDTGLPAAASDFEVVVDDSPDGPVVWVRGEVDVYTAPRLREELAKLGATTSRLVLDLSRMTFIDSTGLGVIVGTHKRVQDEGGELVLRAPSRSTRKVLDITGLTRVVEIVEG